MSDATKFSTVRQAETCGGCGKRTTGPAGVSFVGGMVCPKCYERAGWENAHSDEDHASNPHPTCPICNP